ncbi:hypothetical protein PV326_002984 [Microctonus aethiopoides]|nr:hypothetical protein PV326_002984 [Microctonus aethiopoides]
MFDIQICASPASGILLMLSLFTWIGICRWCFRYNMKDHEILYSLVAYYVVITVLNMVFLGHFRVAYDCTQIDNSNQNVNPVDNIWR